MRLSNLRIFKFLVMLLLILPMTGCYDFKDIGSTNVILALGVDAIGERGVKVSIEYYKPEAQQGGKSKSGGSSGSTEVRSAVGSSITDALTRFNSTVPKLIDLSHNTVFVFGKTYLDRGIDQALDYLEKQRVLRRNELLMYTSGKAEDVLKADTSPEPINAFGIRDLADQVGKQASVLNTLQFQAIRNYLRSSHVMLLTKVDQNDSGALEYSGVGVIQTGKIAMQLDSKDIPAFALLSGPTHLLTISVPCKMESNQENGSTIDMRLIRTTTKMNLFASGRRVDCYIQIRGQSEVERICPGMKISSRVLTELKEDTEKQIRGQVTALIGKLQEKHIDAMQLGTQIFRRYPGYWRSISNQWPDYLSNVRFHYDVDIIVYRTGLSDNSPDTVFSSKGNAATKYRGWSLC